MDQKREQLHYFKITKADRTTSPEINKLVKKEFEPSKDKVFKTQKAKEVKKESKMDINDTTSTYENKLTMIDMQKTKSDGNFNFTNVSETSNKVKVEFFDEKINCFKEEVNTYSDHKDKECKFRFLLKTLI